MAALGSSALLPQCASCIRRVTRLAWDAGRPLQQVRTKTKTAKTKAAKEAERNIVVKLRKDVRKFGRAGSLVPVNPSTMRNRWFPKRVADYVPFMQLKQLKAEGAAMERDFDFGVEVPLEEVVEEEDAYAEQHVRPQYVRPVEIELLSAARSMELLQTFIPGHIDFARQPIELEKAPAGARHGASAAADLLTAAAMASKPKPDANGIYGSVSTSDVVATIKSALAHNDEAARVILNDADVRFVNGHAEGDETRVKKLGTFTIEIKVPGAEAPVRRSVRIRAKE
ncbi:hypothetical protein EJ04DRAFT_444328 [Polyplosphaeria fusca]|uniref:Ribosomal protein L9 domain-containing protein n=1 Tax=Polyplosphaeria fusca TaxID=682080 RepID=A0A9P4V023_9PLEO|nr:hypothetical protein EJ04DRAFT_444328 [Polyplosphaeria fusca]